MCRSVSGYLRTQTLDIVCLWIAKYIKKDENKEIGKFPGTKSS